jgi:hypothetical protein
LIEDRSISKVELKEINVETMATKEIN